MICEECGRKYDGNQCLCMGRKVYKKDAAEGSDRLSAMDSRHRDNHMHYVYLINKSEHFRNCFLLTNDSNFNDMHKEAERKISDFKRAHGQFFSEIIRVPWFMRCNSPGCEKMGGMSAVGKDTPRFCNNHFNV